MQHGSTKYKCAIRACLYGFSLATTNHPNKSTTIRARQDVQQDTTEIKSLSPPCHAEELATMPPPPLVDSATTACTGIRHELLSPLYGKSGGGARTSKYVFNWFRVDAVNAGMNPSPFSDDLPCRPTNSQKKTSFLRPKPGNIYFSLSLVELHRGIIETSPAGLRRHTAAAPARDFAVIQCCALEGGSITAPSSYHEMLTCCRDTVRPAPAAN